ncbi:uncharacterized protein LOC105155229 isoform X2 [Sesamum indicum]|uniref:Uncharacterized protein LOC105155229 isoform X2 n=1 Tax=Sesamum indicum TaxID=4182 RepID=A0A6I9SIU5_SESIN|nr:uncharacterized protein LOC105155229 isoform X2 [Sesamum indicum]
MGNAVGSFFSGFAQVVGNNLGHPLDFLSGKSCNSVCGSTWDILCYIENFCVAHLLKLGMVATLSYFGENAGGERETSKSLLPLVMKTVN